MVCFVSVPVGTQDFEATLGAKAVLLQVGLDSVQQRVGFD